MGVAHKVLSYSPIFEKDDPAAPILDTLSKRKIGECFYVNYRVGGCVIVGNQGVSNSSAPVATFSRAPANAYA